MCVKKVSSSLVLLTHHMHPAKSAPSTMVLWRSAPFPSHCTKLHYCITLHMRHCHIYIIIYIASFFMIYGTNTQCLNPQISSNPQSSTPSHPPLLLGGKFLPFPPRLVQIELHRRTVPELIAPWELSRRDGTQRPRVRHPATVDTSNTE